MAKWRIARDPALEWKTFFGLYLQCRKMQKKSQSWRSVESSEVVNNVLNFGYFASLRIRSKRTFIIAPHCFEFLIIVKILYIFHTQSWTTLFRAVSSHQQPPAHVNQEKFPAISKANPNGLRSSRCFTRDKQFFVVLGVIFV